METISPSGLRIEHPDDVTVISAAGVPGGLARSTLATRTPSGVDSVGPLVDAGFEVLDRLDFSSETPGFVRRGPMGGDTVVDVPLAIGQQEVVLLVEADGLFHWELSSASIPPGAIVRGPGAGLPVKRFTLSAPPATARAAPTTRGPIFDWITGTTLFRVTVLRFVGGGVEALAARIDGPGPFGLLELHGDQPLQWLAPSADAPPLSAPEGCKKILLLVHGTFSSTRGSFGDLLTSEEGAAFIAAARKGYDLVLGFDHPTLGAATSNNARELADALEKLHLPADVSFDAVAFSRGGLVLRGLVEQELPTRKDRLDLRPGRMIFVGCTNGGTHLAEPKNWGALVDCYTTLCLTAAKTTAGIPVLGEVTRFAAVAVPVVGRFVQLMVLAGVNEQHTPGLTSMKPGGEVVTALNAATGKQKKPGYAAITANYQPGPLGEPNSGPAFVALNRVADDLFKTDNDLVVDTASMTSFWTGADLDAIEAFKTTHDVYHTAYFASPRIARKLMEWLDLGAPATTRSPPPLTLPDSTGEVLEGLVRGEAPSLDDVFERFNPPGEIGPLTRAAPPNFELPEEAPSTSPAAPQTTPSIAGVDMRGPLVSCDIAASIAPVIPVATDVTLTVIVSRGVVTVASSSTAAVGHADLFASMPLVLKIIALANCAIVENGMMASSCSRDIEVPHEVDATRVERFTIRAGEAQGAARIAVSALQNGKPVLELELAPQIVAADGSLTKRADALLQASPAPSSLLLRIYQTRTGEDRWQLRFIADCPDASLNLDYSTEISVDPAAYARDRYAEIERAMTTKGDFAARTKQLIAHGGAMADRMIPAEVRSAIWANRGRIGAVQVVSDEAPIPWEMASLQEDEDQEAIFLAEFGLVRWIKNVPWPADRLRLHDANIRLLAPKYPDTWNLPGAQEEITALQGLFPGAQRMAGGREEWSEFLVRRQPVDALHVACHGIASGGATTSVGLFLSEKPDDLFVNDEVQQNLRFAADCAPIVFLNACQTGRPGAGIAGVDGFAQAFLKPKFGPGAAVVVAPLWSVGDLSARGFALTFYEVLKKGAPLVDAVRQGRAEARKRGELTWLAYSVYGDPFAKVSA